MATRMVLMFLALPMLFAFGQSIPETAMPSDADIHQMLVNRIDVEHQSVGLVVGIIDAKGRRVMAYGALEKGDPRLLNGDTIFEIGAATKVFTSLLLADMVERGEVALEDPVAKYLPATVKMPSRNGRSITLIDLATHTSGLPRLPGNMNPNCGLFGRSTLSIPFHLSTDPRYWFSI